MADYNTFRVNGVITEDAQFTGNKKNMVTFTIRSVQNQWNKELNRSEEIAKYFQISVWGGKTETEVIALHDKCRQGQRVDITGTLDSEEKTGQYGSYYTIKLSVWSKDVLFCKSDADFNCKPSKPETTVAAKQDSKKGPESFPDFGFEDEHEHEKDIPF